MDTTSNILDPVESELDQTVFDGTEPKDRVQNFIQRLYFRRFAKEFGIQEPKDFIDLYITGSLTTYQYSETSDCDVSVFPHYEAFESALGINADEARKRLVSLSIKHIDGTFLPATTHPLQFFVVASGIEPTDLYKKGLRSAYSLSNRQWVIEPEKERSHDVKLDFPDAWERASRMADKMRDALDHAPERARELWHQIHMKRTLEQRAGQGDFSEGNIVYKWLLNQGLFERIKSELGEYIASATQDGRVALYAHQTAPKAIVASRWVLSKGDEMQVIYDYEADRIILGSKAESSMYPHTKIIGTYDGKTVTLNQAEQVWLNANYFRRLWAYSFPKRSLDEVKYKTGMDDVIDLPTRPPRKRKTSGVDYVQAYMFLGDPFNKLLIKPGVQEHTELVMHWLDESDGPYQFGGADPEEVVWNTPIVAGHIGMEDYSGHKTPHHVFNVYSGLFRSMGKQQQEELEFKAYRELKKVFPDIEMVSSTNWSSSGGF